MLPLPSDWFTPADAVFSTHASYSEVESSTYMRFHRSQDDIVAKEENVLRISVGEQTPYQKWDLN